MPSDGYADYIEESGYSLDMLYDQPGHALPVKRILVMLDACFSGESPVGALLKEIQLRHTDQRANSPKRATTG